MSDTLEQLEAEFAAAGQADRELALLEKILPLSPRRALELATKTLDLYREIRDKENIPFALLFIANCHFRLTDYPSALSDVAEAQTYFNKSKNKIGIARCHRLIGEVHLRSGEYAQALEHLVKALEMFEEAGDKVRIGATLNSIATVYLKLGSYSVALEYYLRILDEDESALDPSELAVYLNGIGTTYMHLYDYDKAKDFFDRSIELNDRINNVSGKAHVLANLGKACEYLDQLDLALSHQQNALQLHVSLGNRYGEAFINLYIGSVYENQSKFNEAYNHFESALRISQELNSDELRANAYANLARLYYDNKDYPAAIEKFESALQSIVRSEQKSLKIYVLKCLSNSWQALGDYHKAHAFLKEYSDLKEELFSQEKQRLIAERQASFEIEKARREKEEYRVKIEQAIKEMEFKNKELTVMAMTIVQKNELLAKLKKEVRTIATKDDAEAKSMRNTILQQIEEGIDSENDWQMFEQQFKNVHQDFNSTLSKKYPNLTPTELKVCSLIRTGLTSKEIANLLFITHRTVELHRTRIRKKLCLSHTANLTSFLSSISSERDV